jgi:thiol-disulfide isomerase/thioredoxin
MNLSRSAATVFALTLISFTAGAVEVGETAPCVVLNQISANGIEAEHCIRDPKVTGEKVVLEFFLTTCSDCQANLPIFSDLASRLSGKATFRLVGTDRSEAAIRGYLQSNASLIAGAQIETALDTQRDARRAYSVVATPTLFILDSQNTVLYRHTGILKPSDVQAIEQILK